MKKLFVLLVFAATSTFACAQKLKPADVPAAVKTKFASMYPNVKNPEWGKEGNNYEAEFDINKIENSVTFDASGNVVETEVGIQVSDLPQAARDYVAKNLPGKKISEASKITDAAGKITYEAEVKGLDYIFDDQGNFLKTAKD